MNIVERTLQGRLGKVMLVAGSSEGKITIPGPLRQDERGETGPITRQILIGMKTRGLRRRVWYRALDRMERGLVDLTIRWVDKVRSGRMTETLMRILEKLAQAMETGMGRVLGRGRELALRASVLAVEWGNSQAYAWRFDESFWRGLPFARPRENWTGPSQV